MSLSDLRDTVTAWKDFITTLVGIAALLGPILFAGLLALWGDDVRKWSQDFLGITEIVNDLREITGADRVIRQPLGFSFVKEPVYEGAPIVLVLFIARTEVGASYVLQQVTPIFTDEGGATYGGTPMPAIRQIGTDVTRLEVALEPPEHLGTGHTIVQLQLAYAGSGGQIVFEMTDPVSFTILPRNE